MNLSDAARSLFRLHVERMGRIDVDDLNRSAYQELERAGLVVHRRPFTGNQLYGLTQAGAELRDSLIAPSPAGSAALPR